MGNSATRKYDEIREMFTELNKRQNYLWEKRNDHSIRLNTSTSRNGIHLYALEIFIRKIAHGNAPTFKEYFNDKTNKQLLDALDLDFSFLATYLQLYTPHYTYSVYATVFFEVCNSLGLMNARFSSYYEPSDQQHPSPTKNSPLLIVNKNTTPEKTMPFMFQWEVFDKLVLQIKETVTSSDIKNKARLRKKSAMTEYKRAIEYVNACFEAYPTLFVLRVDLGYRLKLPHHQYRADTSGDLTVIKKDFAALTKKFSVDDTFKDLVGHLAKLEFGLDKGYSIHLVMLFDGKRKRTEEDWLRLVGDYWVYRITQSAGMYHNCNIEKDPYFPEKGLGYVKRDNEKKRRALEQWVIGYLTKSSEYLKVNVQPRERVFFKGNFPKNAKNI